MIAQEVDASNLGLERFEGTTLYVRATLDWQVTPNDALQLTGGYDGRATIPQGYTEPNSYFNVGYKRRLSDRTSAVLTVSDVTNSLVSRTHIDVPGLRRDMQQRADPGSVTLGLTYSVGGKSKPVQFEY